MLVSYDHCLKVFHVVFIQIPQCEVCSMTRCIVLASKLFWFRLLVDSDRIIHHYLPYEKSTKRVEISHNFTVTCLASCFVLAVRVWQIRVQIVIVGLCVFWMCLVTSSAFVWYITAAMRWYCKIKSKCLLHYFLLGIKGVNMDWFCKNRISEIIARKVATEFQATAYTYSQWGDDEISILWLTITCKFHTFHRLVAFGRGI